MTKIAYCWTKIFVYQMGGLCGGAHEISGIPAPLWLCGWVVERIMGWVLVMWVVVGVGGWVGGGYVGCGGSGWVGVGYVGYGGVGGWVGGGDAGGGGWWVVVM